MKIKPRQHIMNAAIFWTAIGLFLSSLGVHFVLHGSGSQWIGLWALLAFCIGAIKSQTVLRKATHRVIQRVQNFKQPEPFYKVFHPAQWGLIAFMMGLGFIVRSLGIDKQWRGLVLIAVGVALLGASRFFWKEWCKGASS